VQVLPNAHYVAPALGHVGQALFHALDGHVIRFVLYLDQDEALADLGLVE
jgi:hypothetical protein